jgi:hypothetical protein
MAVFDTKTFLTLTGQGQDAFGAVGTAFGVPSCLLNLGREVLKLLPSEALFGILGEMESGQAMADGVTKGIMSQVRNVLGIIEWDSEEGGFKFVSNSSEMGYESNQGSTLGALGALVNGVAALAGGLYANYQIASQQIKEIENCIKSYRNYLKFKNGNAAEELSKLDPVAYDDFINEEYMLEMAALRQAIDFQNNITNKIKEIKDIIFERIEDPTLEPVFVCEALPYFSGTGLASNCLTPKQEKEIFRLVYGPPKSIQGQFILSNDGIYFDSQSSGITPALSYIADKKLRLKNSDQWKFAHDPNLGGRGDSFSTKDLESYINTILDPNIIDESSFIKTYYASDGFLLELINNKNKRIYDMSAQISELEQDSAPQAIIFNQKQSLLSENASLIQKVNKRKKQIELAIKLPSIYGTFDKQYAPGEVPVNDFSYLQGINLSLDIQRQKALSFSQVEIDGLVSPIQLTNSYVVSRTPSRNSTLEHLIISELGDGAIIYDGSSVSSADAVILPLNHSVTTDSLFAMYNFLDTNLEDPSSTSFTLRNSAYDGIQGYAQLVGKSLNEVYKHGLGMAYLEGITKHSSSDFTKVSSLGSYVKLPSFKEFTDLLYNFNGATIDFWVHMPNINCVSGGYNQNNTSSLFRLILANENTGYDGTTTTNSPDAELNDFGTRTVRGFMLGFSRDVRLTSNTSPSMTNPIQDSVFFIAPTQSLSSSSVGLIRRSNFDDVACSVQTGYHSMTQKINTASNDKYFSSCGNEFCHVAVTFDRINDSINFYLDGSLVTTSGMSTVFGIEKYSMPNLPTFKKANSFTYAVSTLNSDAPTELKLGPKLDKYFTPWIVGGGYTDGMYQYGNFMGTQYGGVRSGLRGYLGSFKLYSKPLNSTEVLNNYEAQRGFFKNIDTSYLSIGVCQD